MLSMPRQLISHLGKRISCRACKVVEMLMDSFLRESFADKVYVSREAYAKLEDHL